MIASIFDPAVRERERVREPVEGALEGESPVRGTVAGALAPSLGLAGPRRHVGGVERAARSTAA